MSEWTQTEVREYMKTGKEPIKRRRSDATSVIEETTLSHADKSIRFTIPGTPVGKPRMTRRDKWKKRPCVMRYRSWADSARLAAGRLPQPEAIDTFSWTAYLPPPRSWSAKKRAEAMGTLHRGRPDRDNIDKAVLDALFLNDSAIASGMIRKVWGEPARVEVVLTIADSLPGKRREQG